MQLGIEHHRAGRFEAAEAAYRHVLAIEPEGADTLHLLGLLAYQRQRHEQALDLINRAIRLQGDRAVFHNNAALALLGLGRLDEAEASCHRAISLDPAYPVAHGTLGTVLRLGGRLDEAEFSCGAAIGLDPALVAAHCQLGQIRAALGRPGQAVESFRAALRLAPGLLDAHLGLAAVLRELGRIGELEPCFRHALRQAPGDPELHNMLGVTLRSLARPAEAEACYREALRLAPDFAEAHNNLGSVLSELGRHGEAESGYRAALRLKPDYAEAYSNLGAALLEQGRAAEAEECQRAALRLLPGLAEAHFNLGSALLAQGRTEAAEERYREAVALKPGYADAHFNLGAILFEQRRLAEAEASYQTALARQPVHARAHYNLGHLLLLTGRLEEGWPHYDWRIEAHGAGRRDFLQPFWEGESLGDGVLLLHAEQGLGDTLQFCRYAPVLARRAKVVFEVPVPLLPLLESNLSGIARIVAAGDALPPFDAHLPLLSAPHRLGTDLATIPAEIPYLAADPQRCAFWRRRMVGLDGLRVGLVWAGGLGQDQPDAVDRRRSMMLEQLSPLADIDGVHFLSLQKGKPAAQALSPPGGMVLHDFTGELADFADTAALVDGLDLVISVDTAVAHLAGAMGKPVWLLNRFDSCWRWLQDRDDSPWYPSLRQFRQPAAGDWASVMTKVKAALVQLAQNRRPA
jgi:tetratricopeptide (TPR) repeat protein